MPAEFH